MQDVLIKSLKELKLSFGAVGVKAEFESEGATFAEVKILKQIADAAELDFILKIGGCEALRDLKDARLLGIKTIVAPMIESEYAFSKFVQGAKKVLREDANLWINIETPQGISALDAILQNENSEFLSGVVFGRTDFSNAAEIGDVNNSEVSRIIKDVCKKMFQSGKRFVVGGGITPQSVNLLKGFGTLNGVETRKILFDFAEMSEKSISKALEFEMNWLEYKRQFSPDACDEDRLRVLKTRSLLM